MWPNDEISETVGRIRERHGIEVRIGETESSGLAVLRELERFEEHLAGLEHRDGLPVHRATFGPQHIRRAQ